VGNGSEDIIDLLFRFCVTVGDEVIIPQYSFPCYGIRAQSVGATVVWVKSDSYQISLEKTLCSITPKTKLVCLATPNNPTGQWSDPKQVMAWIEAIPQRILILLDEAYYEYLSAAQLSHAHQWLDRYPNVLVTRTFSKIYGLAGVRLGYGIGRPDLIQWLNRIRQPFNTSRIAQQLGVAALSDQTHVQLCQSKTQQERVRLSTAMLALGLQVLPSHANFITIETGVHTEAMNQALLRSGIIIRPLIGFKMPNFMRVSIGKPAECDRFLNTFTTIWRQIT
jgi:histidinol-phosphate aminotransferase